MASGAYTHRAYTRTLKVISRNQAHAGLWRACAWFNKNIHHVGWAALILVSVSGQYQHILMVSELIKYIIQLPILLRCITTMK